MRSCARCSRPVRAERQRYCRVHHAEYQRKWRAENGILATAARRILGRLGAQKAS